jgi:hypothetical protein
MGTASSLSIDELMTFGTRRHGSLEVNQRLSCSLSYICEAPKSSPASMETFGLDIRLTQ